MLCEHDAYCSFRLNVNMHLLILLAQKLVFGDEFLAQGLHLQSHQRC